MIVFAFFLQIYCNAIPANIRIELDRGFAHFKTPNLLFKVVFKLHDELGIEWAPSANVADEFLYIFLILLETRLNGELDDKFFTLIFDDVTYKQILFDKGNIYAKEFLDHWIRLTTNGWAVSDYKELLKAILNAPQKTLSIGAKLLEMDITEKMSNHYALYMERMFNEREKEIGYVLSEIVNVYVHPEHYNDYMKRAALDLMKQVGQVETQISQLDDAKWKNQYLHYFALIVTQFHASTNVKEATKALLTHFGVLERGPIQFPILNRQLENLLKVYNRFF